MKMVQTKSQKANIDTPTEASVLSDRSLLPLSVSDPNKEIAASHGIEYRPAIILDGEGNHLFTVGDDAEAVILAHNLVRAVNNFDALVKALEFLMQTKWKSVDRDNMEFEGRITCYQLDAIRAALESARSNP